jgi:hypothetical protein
VFEARRLNDEANKTDFDKLSGALTSISDASRGALREFVIMSAAFGHLDKDVKGLADSSVPAAQEFVRLAESIGLPQSKIRELNKIIDEKKSADIGGQKAQADYTAEVDNAAGALDTEADSANAAADAITAKADAERAAIDPLFAMQDALQGNVDAQGDVNAKQLEAVAAEKAYLAAVDKHGPKSKEAQAASLELMGAQKALTDANRGAVRSAQDVDSAIAGMRAEIEKNPKALDQAKEKLREWQRQGLITAAQAKSTAAEFDDLAGSIRRVPGSKTVAVGIKGINSAKVQLASMKSDLDRFPTSKNVTIHFAATGLAAISIAKSKLLAGEFALGGRVPGPKGSPQIILAHGGEEVVPLHDPNAMKKYQTNGVGHGLTGGGGGGSTYVDNRTISIQVTSNDGKAVVEAIKKYERSNGTGWRG